MIALCYVTGIATAALIITALAQWQFNKIDKTLPKDLTGEAFKAATRPKPKLKELE